jgi:hypothetical protein
MDNSDSFATLCVRDNEKTIDVRSADADKPFLSNGVIRVGTIQNQRIGEDCNCLAERNAVFA